MRNTRFQILAAAAAAALIASLGTAGDAQAQKIICWKDKSGKTVGCGDKVPPEYQDNATRELDKRGVTRRTTETAEERARREAQEKAQATQKAAEAKKLAEQRRQDAALINTFSNEKEIDLKRDRDLQVVDGQITQMRVSHKNASDRYNEVKGRMDGTIKSGKPATETQKEDLARAEAERTRLEQSIAEKEKEKDAIRKRYAEMKERYIALRGGPTAAAAAKK